MTSLRRDLEKKKVSLSVSLFDEASRVNPGSGQGATSIVHSSTIHRKTKSKFAPVLKIGPSRGTRLSLSH